MGIRMQWIYGWNTDGTGKVVVYIRGVGKFVKSMSATGWTFTEAMGALGRSMDSEKDRLYQIERERLELSAALSRLKGEIARLRRERVIEALPEKIREYKAVYKKLRQIGGVMKGSA